MLTDTSFFQLIFNGKSENLCEYCNIYDINKTSQHYN